ncbi:MAG TPA: Usg family protein [Acetobacteraceae bacterium]|nr:Usg family protein [Acetobacteraceae bacterium]
MSLALQLQDYRLTTAKIYYHLPDYPAVLQTYVWQEYDIAPRFPVLRKFLDFWHGNLDGKLHSVRVTSMTLIRPVEWRHPAVCLHLH